MYAGTGYRDQRGLYGYMGDAGGVCGYIGIQKGILCMGIYGV